MSSMLLNGNSLFQFDKFTIDLAERTLWRDGHPVRLAPKVMETLCLLVENQGRLMTKEELMKSLWADTFVEERNLTQNIFTLRKALGDGEAGNKFVETLPRRGYRFIAKVQRVTIHEQEAIQVSHNKRTHISAEGFVSRHELTNAVKEIARSLAVEKEIEPVPSNQNRAARPTFFNRSVRILMAGILLVLSAGSAWLWQSGTFDGRAGALALNLETGKLAFERLTESGNVFYPAISPDKQHVAFVLNEKETFSIWLQNVATGSVTEVVSPKDYELRSPQFSRDGNYLFYGARNGGQETTVYQTPVFGGSTRKITTNVNQNFSISPDGEWLAYFRHNPRINGNHLIICRANGSGERIVATQKEGTAFRGWGGFPAWSPDGTKIVASVKSLSFKRPDERKSYFVEINVADGSERILNAPHWNVAFAALWLADGSGLIVQVQDKPDSFFQLWHLAYPSGEARPLTNDTNNYTEFRLAPDSSFIIAAEEKAPYDLQLISADDPTEIRQLTNSTTMQRGYMGLEWTPDGKELIYLQLEGLVAGNLWKTNVKTLETTQLTFDKHACNRDPDITPDGNSIVFASNRTGEWHIWQMTLDGSDLRQITDGIGETSPQVSPDGNWLSYATPGDKPNALWKRLLPGGEPIKILDGAGGAHEVSPDSGQVLASFYDAHETVKDPWKYVVFPFEPGYQPRDIDFRAQGRVVRWNPDGSGIYFLSKGQSHTNIWFYNLADKTVRPITTFDTQEISNFSISPDGSTFAVARGTRASNLLKIDGF